MERNESEKAILIFTEDAEMGKMIKKALDHERWTVTICHSVHTALMHLTSDLGIKIFIYTYSIQGSDPFGEGSRFYEIMKRGRPDVQMHAIGEFSRDDLMIGRNKVLLAHSKEILSNVLSFSIGKENREKPDECNGEVIQLEKESNSTTSDHYEKH